MKAFIRVDIRREVNILPGRTDLEYEDFYGDHILFEFKIGRNKAELAKKEKEGIKQCQKYVKSGKYKRTYMILIDVKKIEVMITRL